MVVAGQVDLILGFRWCSSLLLLRCDTVELSFWCQLGRVWLDYMEDGAFVPFVVSMKGKE
jgi:hypothetical protein